MRGKNNDPSYHKEESIEDKWIRLWEEKGIYKFDKSKEKEEIFSIDTPPPTVSGQLHIGHVFSYTQTDTLARYQRMKGKEVFYSMGWDDNGLPTERRVENLHQVKCDPSLPYVENLQLGNKQSKNAVTFVSRRNFIELCHQVTEEDEKKFEDLWRRLGLSVDWDYKYTTISRDAQKLSQSSFLDLLDKGLAYQKEKEVIWDTTFKTSVANAEQEDRIIKAREFYLHFPLKEGDKVLVMTTRPELLGACQCLIYNPKDSRYTHLKNKRALVPIYNKEVKVLPHSYADPDKGTGLVMISSYGDDGDVLVLKELNLKPQIIISEDGRIEDSGPLQGLFVKQAKQKIAELLKESTHLQEEKEIEHSVKFWEKGNLPLEILPSKQWFIKTMQFKKEMLSLAEEMTWHPQSKKQILIDWIEGLDEDWNISRQRYFGVPIPVWYKLDASNNPISIIKADKSQLPLDPYLDTPPGFEEEQRDQANGFSACEDVLDTWATSSLTPQLVGQNLEDKELYDKVFPFDLRPQAHEIIRTWMFTTILRSFLQEDKLPFKHAAISGWVLDPDRKKMSKSKGNTITPEEIIETHGADATRYWAAKAALGVDTAFSLQPGKKKMHGKMVNEEMLKGRRLATKITNAARFVDTVSGSANKEINYENLQEIDRQFLKKLEEDVFNITEYHDNFDQSSALKKSEESFWDFCDNYLEIVKERAYGDDDGAFSAKQTLAFSKDTYLKLFAPFLPFACEEGFSKHSNQSVHNQGWPKLNFPEKKEKELLQFTYLSLQKIREEKSNQKVSPKKKASLLYKGPRKFTDTELADLKRAGNLDQLVLEEGEEESWQVTILE